MDRREAILRELNVYPLWVRRNATAPVAVKQPVPETVQEAAHLVKKEVSRLGGGEADTQRSAMGIVALNPSYGLNGLNRAIIETDLPSPISARSNRRPDWLP